MSSFRARRAIHVVLVAAVTGCSFTLQAPSIDGTTGEIDADADAAVPVEGLAHKWSFDDGTARDLAGTADGVLFNGASISNGVLQLDGINDYMRTAPIEPAISERSLVVWVTLSNLTQRAGGALTIENPTNTDVFDAIVFAERVSGQWMAGSDFFARTPTNNGGPLEAATQRRMIAIVYDTSDGITSYRDGQLYGQRYAQGSLQIYPAGVADVLIGVRHQDRVADAGGTPTGNDPFLAATIDEARIYDRALPGQDVARLAVQGP